MAMMMMMMMKMMMTIHDDADHTAGAVSFTDEELANRDKTTAE